MINPNLYAKPVAVDNTQHRNLKAGRVVDDWSVAARLNSIFVVAVEFGDVSAEYPIVAKQPNDGSSNSNFPGNYEFRVQQTTGNLVLGFNDSGETYVFAVS